MMGLTSSFIIANTMPGRVKILLRYKYPLPDSRLINTTEASRLSLFMKLLDFVCQLWSILFNAAKRFSSWWLIFFLTIIFKAAVIGWNLASFRMGQLLHSVTITKKDKLVVIRLLCRTILHRPMEEQTDAISRRTWTMCSAANFGLRHSPVYQDWGEPLDDSMLEDSRRHTRSSTVSNSGSYLKRIPRSARWMVVLSSSFQFGFRSRNVVRTETCSAFHRRRTMNPRTRDWILIAFSVRILPASRSSRFRAFSARKESLTDFDAWSTNIPLKSSDGNTTIRQ